MVFLHCRIWENIPVTFVVRPIKGMKRHARATFHGSGVNAKYRSKNILFFLHLLTQRVSILLSESLVTHNAHVRSLRILLFARSSTVLYIEKMTTEYFACTKRSDHVILTKARLCTKHFLTGLAKCIIGSDIPLDGMPRQRWCLQIRGIWFRKDRTI